MARFKDRDEYEEWKREKVSSNLERSQPPEEEGAKEEAEPDESKADSKEVQQNSERNDLRSVGDLFSDSWEIYKKRFGTLISLYLLSILVLLGLIGIFVGTGFGLSILFPQSKVMLITGWTLVGVVSALLCAFWCIAAFILAVLDDNLDFKEAMGKGWEKVFPFMWLYSLIGFIVVGGFLLFFIPGVIFLIWFGFAQFILFGEDVRGMDALLKSKEYVRDKWFDVFLRFCLIWLASGAIGLVPFLGPVLSILFFPFVMIFKCLIYRDLKLSKGENLSYAQSPGEKFKWIGVSVLGYIVFPLLIIIVFIGIFGASLAIPLMLLNEMLHR